MAFKRALVVDDSKTARQSLARLLADYDMEVAFADSGEAALEFLHHELVDVIFMDHTMPGMDGLEAVSAIKSNPRTATIPVMMYTTKEGEVYVSQARALGAVGVLPKKFHPNVLFEMLQKLGLVTDRRIGEPPPTEPPPRRRITDVADEVDAEYDRRAQGVSVQTLMERILEEQHLKLRAEILSSQRRFAREVAEEILAHQSSADSVPDGAPVARGQRWHGALVTGLALAVMALTVFGWQMTAQRDAALLEAARLGAATRNELDALSQRNAGLNSALQSASRQAGDRLDASLAAMQWALNEPAMVPPGARPFGDDAARRLAALIDHLRRLGFTGTVRVTAALAPYCLVTDATGVLVPAPPERSTGECDVLAHPLADVTAPELLQSIEFATLLDELEATPDLDVELATRALAPGDGPFPGVAADDAGEWNRLAAAASRLTFGLEAREPMTGPALADSTDR
jgi:CheY-like chemotaxis protein